MEYAYYPIKELVSMEYTNLDEENISVYDFLNYYKKYLNNDVDSEYSYKINLLNAEGILLLEPSEVTVYFACKDNNIGTIKAYINEENHLQYKLNCEDKLLNWSLGSREESLLRKLYIKINKCPIDIKEDIFNLRQEIIKKEKHKSTELKRKVSLYKKRNLERRKIK